LACGGGGGGGGVPGGGRRHIYCRATRPATPCNTLVTPSSCFVVGLDLQLFARHRNRAFTIKFEQTLSAFIEDASKESQQCGSIDSSFHRLLVHRVAELCEITYEFKHILCRSRGAEVNQILASCWLNRLPYNRVAELCVPDGTHGCSYGCFFKASPVQKCHSDGPGKVRGGGRGSACFVLRPSAPWVVGLCFGAGIVYDRLFSMLAATSCDIFCASGTI